LRFNFDDPRNDFHCRPLHNLSPYKKATALLKFHRRCITNMIKHFPDDWTERPPIWIGDEVDWNVLTEENERIALLQEFNKPLYNLLTNIAELMMADRDLGHEGGPKFFRNAFIGCRVNNDILQNIESICKGDSNLRNKMSIQMAQKGRIICPLISAYIFEEFETFCDDLMYTYNNIVQLHHDETIMSSCPALPQQSCIENFSDHQFCYLGNSIFKVLMMRNKSADDLFGLTIADGINILHAARRWTIPNLKTIIPCNRIPCISDFAYFPERQHMPKLIVFNLHGRNQKRQRVDKGYTM